METVLKTVVGAKLVRILSGQWVGDGTKDDIATREIAIEFCDPDLLLLFDIYYSTVRFVDKRYVDAFEVIDVIDDVVVSKQLSGATVEGAYDKSLPFVCGPILRLSNGYLVYRAPDSTTPSKIDVDVSLASSLPSLE